MTRIHARILDVLAAMIVVLFCCTVAGFAEELEEQDQTRVEFFESKIRPVLVEHCYKCHSSDSKKVKGGLLLDTKQGIRQGGESGDAIIPGNPSDSLLLSAIKYEDYEMPPSGKLPDSVIADFEKWIDAGAVDPRNGNRVVVAPTEIDIEKGREFWAFQSVASPEVPTSKSSWPRNDIDRFILAKLDEHSLQPVKDADKRQWLRRVTFDLTGLPPTIGEIQAFIADDTDSADATVVDRLLDSPHFGERWARHWLDVVRFAESIGKTRNFPFPFAWRYRDYAIRAFNEDKPYDQFVIEQLAGDLLPQQEGDQQIDQLVATGFLAIGSHDLNEGNNRQFDMDVVGEQIDVVSRSMLGLTLGCARCHDHKFDPIPTHDYYALAGIFRSTEILNGLTNKRRNNAYFLEDKFHRLAIDEQEIQESVVETPKVNDKNQNDKRLENAHSQVDALKARMVQIRKNRELDKTERKNRIAEVQRRIQEANKRIRRLAKRQNMNKRGGGKALTGPFAMGVAERENVVNCKINIRGDVTKLGEEVPRGFVQVVYVDGHSIPANVSGRLELANWIADPKNPLTSRVMVNRIWHHLFGKGLVRTTDNFGTMGDRPSHPELLDFLATNFVENGWSTKSLIRSIVLSRTYRLGTENVAANQEVDGGNRWLWKMNRRRLEAEAIRDAMLSISGSLERTPPKSSVVSSYPMAQIGKRAAMQMGLDDPHRSVYLPIIRGHVDGFLTTFDFPEPSDVHGRRDVTTVATQALFMMNSDFVLEQSRLAAEKLVANIDDDQLRVQTAFLTTLGREPTDHDISRTMDYLKFVQRSQEKGVPDKTNVGKLNAGEMTARKKKRQKNQQQVADGPVAAWQDVYHAILSSAEFRYR